MTRPKKSADETVDKVLSVRVRSNTADQIGDIRTKLQRKAPFADITTADAMRHIIDAGLSKDSQ